MTFPGPTPPPIAPPGWYLDAPSGRWLWWDGWQWVIPPTPPTPARYLAADVAAEPTGWFPTTPTLQFPAAIAGVTFIVLFTIASRLLTLLPSTAAGLLSLALLVVNTFGMPLLAWWCCRKWGTGSMVRDIGLRARWIDIPIGIAGGVTLVIGLFVYSIVSHVIGLPNGSNLTDVAKEGRSVAVFVFLIVTAGLIAPIVEEMVFRGVIQRGIASKVTPWAAVGLQAVVFGMAHVTPSEGWGNVNLILGLALTGLGLGAITRSTGRLATSMIAHATFNLIELGLLWLTLR